MLKSCFQCIIFFPNRQNKCGLYIGFEGPVDNSIIVQCNMYNSCFWYIFFLTSNTHVLYRVSQKKRNGGLLVHCELKVLHVFIPLYRASSAEENDTYIITFGWVILILWSFLEIRSFSNFAGFLRPMSGELWQNKPSIRCFCWSPLIRGNKRNTEQWASTGRRMDCLSRQTSSLIRPKNPANFENYRISRNGHGI